jgi:hypothetical protein
MQTALRDFFESYVYPLVDALAVEDESAYTNMRRELVLKLQQPGTDADVKCAAQYILSYYIFLHTTVLDQTALQAEALAEALQGFAPAPQGYISSLIQRRYLLQLRILAHNAGIRDLPLAEMERLAAALPPGERHTEQWFYLSEYYFRLGSLTHAIEAYEQYMESSSSWARDYNWRRLNVMVKLLDGTATRLDAELLIKAIVVPGCEKEIHRSFWPHFVRLGFADASLEELLAQCVDSLRRQGEAPPDQPA